MTNCFTGLKCTQVPVSNTTPGHEMSLRLREREKGTTYISSFARKTEREEKRNPGHTFGTSFSSFGSSVSLAHSHAVHMCSVTCSLVSKPNPLMRMSKGTSLVTATCNHCTCRIYSCVCMFHIFFLFFHWTSGLMRTFGAL